MNGYGAVTWRRDGKKQTLGAHQVAYWLSMGHWLRRSDGLQVRHTCDNRMCVNPAHLLAGSAADNSRDKVDRGRQARGKLLPQAKLTDEDVVDLRRLAAAGGPMAPIAKRFGLSRRATQQVASGCQYKHLPGAVDLQSVRKTSLNPNAKLTDDDVREVRHSTDSYREIGGRYGISPHTVFRVKHRLSYKDVP